MRWFVRLIVLALAVAAVREMRHRQQKVVAIGGDLSDQRRGIEAAETELDATDRSIDDAASRVRELDAELLQLSALRKSRQVVTTRAAKELLQNKVHDFTDARVATETEHNFCSGKLTQPDFLCRSNVQHALATLGRDNEQLERFEDWVSRAETCLSHVRPPSRPNSPIK